MREGLRPEVRYNKNGVPVTKHVRDGHNTPKKSFLSAIAPSLSQKVSDHAESTRLRKRISVNLVRFGSDAQRAEATFGQMRYIEEGERVLIERDFHEHDIGTLRRIDDLYENSGREEAMQVSEIIAKVRNERWVVEALNFRQFVDNPTKFFSTADVVSSALNDGDALLTAVEGTEEYARVARFVALSMRMENESSPAIMRYMMTKKLVEVADDFPDRDEDIMDFFREHSTEVSFSPELLREYLDSPSKALREGVL